MASSRDLALILTARDEMKAAFDSASGSLDKLEGKFGGLGAKAAAGTALAGAAIGAAAVGIGAAAINVASDYQSATRTIAAQTGLQGDALTEVSNVAKGVYQNAFGESAQSVAADVAKVRQSFGDLGAEQLQGVSEAALTFKDAFGVDVQESVRGASVMAKQFGIDGTQAFDVVTAVMQKTGDAHGDLLDTFQEYSPLMKQAGFDAEGFGDILVRGAEAGIRNYDLTADAVKEYGIRIRDTAKLSQDAFKTLGIDQGEFIKQIDEGGITGDEAFKKIVSSILAIEDPLKRQETGVALLGTKWEDVGEDTLRAMVEAEGGLENVEGATKRAGDALYDNFGTRFESVKRQAMGMLEPIGASLLGVADDVLKNVMPAIQRIGDGFSDAGFWGAAGEAGNLLANALGLDPKAVGDLINQAEEVFNTIGTKIGEVVAGFQEGGLAGGATSILTSLFGMEEGAAEGLVERIRGVIDTVMATVGEIMAGFQSGGLEGGATSILTSLFGMDGDAAAELVGKISEIAGQISSFVQEQLLPALMQIGDWIINTGVPAWMSMHSTIQSTVIPILQQLGGFIMEQVIPAVQEFVAAFQRWANEIAPLIGPALANIQSIIQTVMGAISSFWNEHWGTIRTVLEAVWGTIKAVIETSLTIVGGIIKAALQIIGGDWSGAWDTIKETLGKAWEIMSSNTSKIMGQIAKFIGDKAEEARSALATKFEEARAAVADKIGQILSNVTTKLGELVDGARRALSDMGQAIRDGLAGIASWVGGMAASIGQSIVDGLLRAIRGGIGAVGDAARNLAQSAVDSARNALGIQSPSREMYGLGAYTVEGFERGMLSRMESLRAIADEITSIVRQGMGQVAQAVTTGGQQASSAFDRYIAHVRQDGDYLNDALVEMSGRTKAEAFRMGVNIAAGMEGGLADKFGHIARKASEMGLTVIREAGRVLGIQSPSDVMEQIGQHTGEGLVLGLRSMIPDVEAAANALVDAAIPSGSFGELLRDYMGRDDKGRLGALLEERYGVPYLPNPGSRFQPHDQVPDFARQGKAAVVVNIGVDRFDRHTQAVVRMDQARRVDRANALARSGFGAI